MWKPTKILTLDTQTKEWTKTEFNTFLDWRNFIVSQWSLPGKYNFKNTEYWRECALKFEKTKKYCDYESTSQEYKDFWLLERRKCEQGIIVDGRYISGDLYFFWNYCMIPNKLEQRETFPEIWDGHYHLDLYCQLAEAFNEDIAGTKSRQKGISLYFVARIIRKLWFGKKYNLKIVAEDEEYVMGEWSILQGYRNHLNENTGWYRNFSPDETLNWEQKTLVTEGTSEKKATYKGTFCKLKGLTTKMNVAKAVGGAAKEIYVTEAGINKKLKKIKEFVDPNLKLGNVKTGMFIAMGAAGDLNDAQDLMDMCFNPRGYNIRTVQVDINGKTETQAFFFPEEWNYTYQDPDTGEVIKCYDKDGNSNIDLAISLVEKEDQIQRSRKDEVSYRLWKSQHPRTMQDAFDQRESNPFPTELLKSIERSILSEGDKKIIVSLERDGRGKISHKFSDDIPISKLRPNPTEDNRGAIIVYEFPIDNPPMGLYYAGVDPIFNLDTSTSESLMAIRVWTGHHEKNGIYCEPYPVCEYIGRHKNVRDTYETCMRIIEWYNARVAVESNVKDFTEWAIRQGKSRFFMRRRELTVINEMVPNSTIRDEIGIRMEGVLKQRALERYIAWLTLPMSTSYDLETGESHDNYYAQKIRDLMLIREMLKYTPKANTDRLIAELCCWIAISSDANKHISVQVKGGFDPNKGKIIRKELPSVFKSGVQRNISKLPSPFRK